MVLPNCTFFSATNNTIIQLTKAVLSAQMHKVKHKESSLCIDAPIVCDSSVCDPCFSMWYLVALLVLQSS